MKHRPVLLAGFLAGVTALASTAPPVLADNNRGSGWRRDGGRSGDNSDRGASRNGVRVSGGATAGQTDRGSRPAFAPGAGRNANTSPFMNRPGGIGQIRPPVTYGGGRPSGGMTATPYGPDTARTSPYRRHGGNPGIVTVQSGIPSAVTVQPESPTVISRQPSGATSYPQRPGYRPVDSFRNWRRYGGGGNGEAGSGNRGNRRRPGTPSNGQGPANGSAPTFGQPGGVDANGVTTAGRVIGTNRPVDQYGRTAAGRALGSPTYPYPTARVNPRIDRVRSNPIFWYNPLSGRYERRGDRDDHGDRDGRWDRDGHGDRDHRRGRRPVFVNVLLGTSALQPGYRFSWGGATHYVFYPYYCNNVVNVNSLDYGYSAFPSPYYYYNYLPQFIPSTRVVVVDRPVYVDREDDVAEDAGDADAYYLNQRTQQAVETAMEDIRNAWMLGDIDLLLRHVRSEQDLGIYLKGKYVYSLPSSDYRDLTQDAMKTSETLSFKWVDVDRKSDDEAVLKAEHAFKDRDGVKHTVFVSFTLLNEHGAWWIAEVGSSDKKDTL